MPKHKQKSFPPVIYVAEHEDNGARYLTADKAPEMLVHMGENVRLARYTFADFVSAKGVVKLGDDK